MHTPDILSELFESPVKVRALKLFLRNPHDAYSVAEGATRLAVAPAKFKREIKRFMNVDLVRSRVVRVLPKEGSRSKAAKKTEVFYVNPHFAFYEELRNLVTKSSPTAWEKKLEPLTKLGKMKLVVICGSLMNDDRARLDFLMVGDRLNPKSVSSFARGLEAEVGKEVRYMMLTPEEFVYRFGMYDNILRDIFERPHRKLINKMKSVVGDDNPGLSKLFVG